VVLKVQLVHFAQSKAGKHVAEMHLLGVSLGSRAELTSVQAAFLDEALPIVLQEMNGPKG